MSDGQIRKPDKDFSKEVDKQLPEAEQLAQQNVQGAIEKLTALEKQTRQASDLPSTSRILVGIVTICKNASDWVTEGKIFVEVERARVTRILSDIKKKQGDLKSATDILCELQVETFGSMERREKTEFILAQVALCIENNDWTQAGILSRKISTKYLSRKPKKTPEQLVKEAEDREKRRKKGEDVQSQRRMIQVLDTEAVEEDPQKLHSVLQRIIYYVILAPYDNEQSDLLHRVHRDSRNSQVSLDAQLLTVPELMRWPEVSKIFGPHLCGTDVFDVSEGQSADPKANKRWEDLRKRVIEHNIDRPARIVNFAKPRDADDVLNEWSGNMKSLLGLLERIDHLITKEEMMARIQPITGSGTGKAD
ncbi:hypothetical protein DID88_002628 [Monilinia fructigena]|uniref:Uncharacterized protein n=1 Tax=Monilinia fructigena TaxID=38457 RepID=A0A395IQH4_9HELO|nr:hypothetical protein DID88_002628 [Monilinia fructigena]